RGAGTPECSAEQRCRETSFHYACYECGETNRNAPTDDGRFNLFRFAQGVSSEWIKQQNEVAERVRDETPKNENEIKHCDPDGEAGGELLGDASEEFETEIEPENDGPPGAGFQARHPEAVVEIAAVNGRPRAEACQEASTCRVEGWIGAKGSAEVRFRSAMVAAIQGAPARIEMRVFVLRVTLQQTRNLRIVFRPLSLLSKCVGKQVGRCRVIGINAERLPRGAFRLGPVFHYQVGLRFCRDCGVEVGIELTCSAGCLQCVRASIERRKNERSAAR